MPLLCFEYWVPLIRASRNQMCAIYLYFSEVMCADYHLALACELCTLRGIPHSVILPWICEEWIWICHRIYI